MTKRKIGAVCGAALLIDCCGGCGCFARAAVGAAAGSAGGADVRQGARQGGGAEDGAGGGGRGGRGVGCRRDRVRRGRGDGGALRGAE